MKIYSVLTGILIGGLPFASLAQGNAQVLTKEAEAACAREFASSKLDPLRSKFPVRWGESVTDEMRKNESKPSLAERTAINAYVDADIACSRYIAIDLFPNDQSAQSEWESKDKKALTNRFAPLRNGKITYAEHFRRDDKRVAESLAAVKAQENSGRYQKTIDDWLSPFKSNYPVNSPWWSFYNLAIATAKEVDDGKITEDLARRMIEDKRLKTNEEIAAAAEPKPVTLNCAFSADNGQRMERPFQIDFARRLINGSTAQFSENEIRWSSPSNDGKYTYILLLNRLSGFASYGTGDFPALFSGHCSQAKRQF